MRYEVTQLLYLEEAGDFVLPTVPVEVDPDLGLIHWQVRDGQVKYWENVWLTSPEGVRREPR